MPEFKLIKIYIISMEDFYCINIYIIRISSFILIRRARPTRILINDKLDKTCYALFIKFAVKIAI